MRPTHLFRPALAALIAAPLIGAAPATQTAILAGGCFWGMEAVFEHVKGVQDVVSGYAGGTSATANYRDVSSERTGHAEAIKIRFDPSRVSYSQLLKVYFAVAHDPTQLNRQGPDVGPSYRSAIFPQTDAQKSVAKSMVDQLRQSHKIVTRIETGRFYPAEEYHQDFVRRNPSHGYVVVNDLPKLDKLRKAYPALWKS